MYIASRGLHPVELNEGPLVDVLTYSSLKAFFEAAEGTKKAAEQRDISFKDISRPFLSRSLT